jgi:hypothetical protein
MVDWLADDRLRRFAVTVLGVISRSEPLAMRELKRFVVSGGIDRDLAEAAIRQATAATERSSTPAGAVPAPDVYVATGRPPAAQGACGIKNRDGSTCSNPGRHVVGDTWSCTTHYKALTRRGQAS